MTLMWPAVASIAGLLSMVSLLEYAWERVYLWLGLALVAIAVHTVVSATDDLEDSRGSELAGSAATFLCCVFIPVVVMIQAGFLDGLAGVGVAALILSSAIYRWTYLDGPNRAIVYGLPATWGILSFLLHAFDASPPAAVLAVGLALILSLVPVALPHPIFGAFWQRPTACMLVVFGAAATYTLLSGFPAMTSARVVFAAAIVYYAALTIVSVRRSPQPSRDV